MGLWGESQVSNDFPKIVDKIPDERRLNRGKPRLNWNAGVIQRTVRLPTFTKRIEVRGRRLALATTALRSPPMHPEARLEGESLDFRRKARVSRRAGVIECRLLSTRLRSEEDECRLYTINAWHCQAHISLNWNLFTDFVLFCML